MNLRRWLVNASLVARLSAGVMVIVVSGSALPDRSQAGDSGLGRPPPPRIRNALNSPAAKRKLSPAAESPPESALNSGSESQANPAVGNAPPLRLTIAATSMYANRILADRSKWIESFGGTQRSEGAVQSGLAWLSRHQARDGSWSAQFFGRGPESRCDKERPCECSGRVFAHAQTGLALLAFQAGGHFHFNKAMYSDPVRRGLDWIVEHQNTDGQLFLQPSNQYMYEHGIATFALAEACALEVAAHRFREVRYQQALDKAVAYLLTQQHDDGGWRYDGYLGSYSDVSVSGWQMLALKSALGAGVKIPQDRLNFLAAFIRGCEMEDHGRTGYILPVEQVTEATTGVGMMLHQFLLKTPRSLLVTQAAPYLAGYAEQNWRPGQSGNIDYYLWYNCTVPMFQAGGASWERWNSVVRPRVVSLQIKDGCEHGSWTPCTPHDLAGGRIYTTALAVLTLEVYYRFSKSLDTKSSAF